MRLFLLLAVVALCLAQTPPPATPSQILAAQQSLQSDIATLKASVTGLVAAQGITVETGCSTTVAGCTVLGTANTIDIEPGAGVLLVPQVSGGVFTLQIVLDSAYIRSLVAAPPPP